MQSNEKLNTELENVIIFFIIYTFNDYRGT